MQTQQPILATKSNQDEFRIKSFINNHDGQTGKQGFQW